MTQVRRRLIRATHPVEAAARPNPQMEKLRTKLASEQLTLDRWMTKLRRACRTVEKQHGRIRRLQRHLSQSVG